MPANPDKGSQNEERRNRRSLAVAVMVIALAFSGVVAGVMVTALAFAPPIASVAAVDLSIPPLA